MLSKLTIKHDQEIVIIPLFKLRPHVSNFVERINLQEMYDNADDNTKQYFKKHVSLFKEDNFMKDYRVNIDMPISHTIYPGEHWQIGFPIYGKYSDNRNFFVEDENQLASNLFLYTIAHQAISANKNNYPYSSLNFNPKELNIDMPNTALASIQEAAWQNQLFVTQKTKGDALLYARTYIGVSFAYVYKEVYDYILMQKQALYLQCIEETEQHLDNVVAYLEEDAYYYCANRDKTVAYDFSKLDKLKEKQDLSYATSINKEFNFYYSELDISPLKFLDKTVNSEGYVTYSWKKDSKDEYRNILLKKAEIFCINHYMNYQLHESWQPIHIAGDDNKERLAFNEAVNRMIHKKD
jgi:hypothetical protein